MAVGLLFYFKSHMRDARIRMEMESKIQYSKGDNEIAMVSDTWATNAFNVIIEIGSAKFNQPATKGRIKSIIKYQLTGWLWTGNPLQASQMALQEVRVFHCFGGKFQIQFIISLFFSGTHT